MSKITKSHLVFTMLLVAGCFAFANFVEPHSALNSPPSLAQSVQLPVSAIKELGTTVISPGQTRDVVEITPQAANGGVFTVPAGQTFVITDVIIFPQNPGAGTLSVSLNQDIRVREFWVFPNNQPFQVHLVSGLLIGSGFSLNIQNGIGGAGPIRVFLTGYLG
jgi:hypothetical protein